MTDKALHPGDRVEWDSAGGRAHGEVVEKVTRTTRVKGHVARATAKDPQYRVRSDRGGEALHKPGALIEGD